MNHFVKSDCPLFVFTWCFQQSAWYFEINACYFTKNEISCWMWTYRFFRSFLYPRVVSLRPIDFLPSLISHFFLSSHPFFVSQLINEKKAVIIMQNFYSYNKQLCDLCHLVDDFRSIKVSVVPYQTIHIISSQKYWRNTR